MSLVRKVAVGRLMLFGVVWCLLSTAVYRDHTRSTFASKPERIGFPWDWSHEHVFCSNTTDPEVLAKIQQDPRLLHRRLRQILPSFQASIDSTFGLGFFSTNVEPLAAALTKYVPTGVGCLQLKIKRLKLL